MQSPTALDRTFHALGDGTRRTMLAMLARRGECTAGDLGAPFVIAQPSVSKHLRVLEEAGLVTRRVAGREHRFRIRDKPLRDAEQWIARHRAFWEASLAQLDSLVDELKRSSE